MSLIPRLVSGLDSGVAVECGTGREISLNLGLVDEAQEFLTGDAAVRKIPSVEVAIVVWFGSSWNGRWSEGSDGVRVETSVPIAGIILRTARGLCSGERGKRGFVFFEGTLSALAASFVPFAFLAFTFTLFLLEVEGIATARL